MKVRVGSGLGTRTITNDAERFAALVDGLEALRFDSLWLSEKITDDCPDPVVALSFAAARTTKLKLGTSVMVLPGRNPMLLAKEMASLDRLAGGRLLPAFGLGQVDPAEQQAFGVERTERARRFDEALPLLRRFWTEDAVDHEGEFFSFRDAVSYPKPWREGGVPIHVGGHSRAAARRAGRFGDGLQPLGLTGDALRETVALMRRSAEESGRDPATLELSLGHLVTRVDADRAGALGELGADRIVLAASDTDDLDQARDEASACAERLGLR